MGANQKKLTPPNFTADDIIAARKRGILVEHVANETLTIGNQEFPIPIDLLAEGHIFIVGTQRVTLSNIEYSKLNRFEAEEKEKVEELTEKKQFVLENKTKICEAIGLLDKKGSSEADYSSEYQELAQRFKELPTVNRLFNFLAMEKIAHSVRLLELSDQLKKQINI